MKLWRNIDCFFPGKVVFLTANYIRSHKLHLLHYLRLQYTATVALTTATSSRRRRLPAAETPMMGTGESSAEDFCSSDSVTLLSDSVLLMLGVGSIINVATVVTASVSLFASISSSPFAVTASSVNLLGSIYIYIYAQSLHKCIRIYIMAIILAANMLYINICLFKETPIAPKGLTLWAPFTYTA